jgi:hypothetical protein
MDDLPSSLNIVCETKVGYYVTVHCYMCNVDLLLGLEIAFTAYNIINYPNSFHVIVDTSLVLGVVILLISLVMAMIIVPLSSYRSPLWISIPLGALYVLFMISCILFSQTSRDSMKPNFIQSSQS